MLRVLESPLVTDALLIDLTLVVWHQSWHAIEDLHEHNRGGRSYWRRDRPQPIGRVVASIRGFLQRHRVTKPAQPQ